MVFLAKLDDPKSWIIAAAAVVGGMLLLRASRYYARQKRERAAEEAVGPPTHGTPSARGEPSGEAANWEVRMYETARDLSAQLDSKMSALQALVAEADRAAARLDAALARAAEAGPAADDRLRQPSTQAESLQHAPRPDHLPADADRLAVRARRQKKSTRWPTTVTIWSRLPAAWAVPSARLN